MGGNKQGIDDELTDLLTKLYTMQEDVGAKPKTSDEEKKQKANTVAATMGSGKKRTQKKGSKFLELKGSVVDGIKAVHALMSQVKGLESSGFGGDNAKEIIKLQAEIREQTRQAMDEWKQMDQLYKNEARKKRSKFTTEELEVQATLVMRLKQELDKIKAEQVKGYQVETASSLPGIPTKNIASFDIAGQSAGGAGLSSWGSAPSSGAALTDGQQLALQQIEERDADFDLQLDELGEGIQDLADIAKMQGEEVKRQGVMLDSLGNKIDKIEEQVSTVNDRMKETLEEVGRASDKLCVDIMCIVLAVGFVAVFYNMLRG
mmetsp:Transcript_25627/g.36129  ORF Transcript_25627/g.36129 Transcript_25627/m.36129 type:complete len:318 (+) Transcript_25627:89-1042(+)